MTKPTVKIEKTEMLNEEGHRYGTMVKAIVTNGTENDGIDALLKEYSEDDLYNWQGDVWDQFKWEIIVS